MFYHDAEEWVPVVNENGYVLTKSLRSDVHNGSKLLHPVVHMHIIDGTHALLLQKRPASKLIQPGKWDTAVGGHVSAGETPAEALKKEAFEEMGLTSFFAAFHKLYKWESDLEAELVYLFSTFEFVDYKIHSEEIEEARFWNTCEIEKALNKGIFTPNFEYEYKILKSLRLVV
jgi:isopentenyldiphosphate isomerase